MTERQRVYITIRCHPWPEWTVRTQIKTAQTVRSAFGKSLLLAYRILYRLPFCDQRCELDSSSRNEPRSSPSHSAAKDLNKHRESRSETNEQRSLKRLDDSRRRRSFVLNAVRDASNRIELFYFALLQIELLERCKV